jgi:hypothetical protein
LKYAHLLAASVFAVLGLGAVSAEAAQIDVTAGSPDGWTFFNGDNAGTNSSGGFVLGPGTPPLGNGSAQFIVGASNSSEILTQAFSGGLNNITALSYGTYVTTSSGVGTGAAPTLQFDLTLGGTYEGRLVYDPGTVNAITDNVWQTWDALSGSGWYFSKGSLVTANGGNCDLNAGTYCTFATALAFLDTQKIDAFTNLFKAGSGQASFAGNVDAYSINGTTFNFDATAVPEPLTLSIFGAGLAGAFAARRRKKKA